MTRALLITFSIFGIIMVIAAMYEDNKAFDECLKHTSRDTCVTNFR